MADRIKIVIDGVEQIITLPDNAAVTVEVDLGDRSTGLMHLAREGTRKGQPAHAWVEWDFGG